ncbi:MAG: hypothetical protein GXD23_11810 [Comamonadaceae bacterium]|jgi:ankyrin repeat protein|nr:hypothetical protein [Comamonadaceae bacterium]
MRPLLTFTLLLATAWLAGCETTPTVNRDSLRALRSNTNDAQVIERLRTSDSADLRDNALAVGLWDQRLDLARAALAAGAGPRRVLPYQQLAQLRPAGDGPSPTRLADALFLPPPTLREDLSQRRVAPTHLFARNLAALNLLLEHGLKFADQDALDESLYAALIVGQDPALADRLVAMGARIRLRPRPLSEPLPRMIAAFAEPAMLQAALRLGLDPNARFSSDPDWRLSRTKDVPYYAYQVDYTMLHILGLRDTSPGNPARERDGAQAVASARLLVAAGADVNARATRVLSAGREFARHDTTPLHNAYLGQNGTVNQALIDYLLEAGADPTARNSAGELPQQMTGQSERTQQEYAQLLAQREQRQAQRTAASSESDSGFFGRAMAIAGLATVGGIAAGSGADPGQLARIVGGGVADVLRDGRAGGIAQAQQQTAPRAVAQAPTGPAFQTENHRFTCPSGVQGSVPLRYRTPQCRAAMIDFAQTYACNAVERFERVRQACQSACGAPTCEQR